MNVPTAKPLETDPKFADQRVYTIEGQEGYFGRLKKAQTGSVVAIHDVKGLRTSHFLALRLPGEDRNL
jgi:hypothetical protein